MFAKNIKIHNGDNLVKNLLLINFNLFWDFKNTFSTFQALKQKTNIPFCRIWLTSKQVLVCSISLPSLMGRYNIGIYLITTLANYYPKAKLMWRWQGYQSSCTMILPQALSIQRKHKNTLIYIIVYCENCECFFTHSTLS